MVVAARARSLGAWPGGRSELVAADQFLAVSQACVCLRSGRRVDLNIHGSRFAYRTSANLVGTRFFSTYQYSPNISAGIVFQVLDLHPPYGF